MGSAARRHSWRSHLVLGATASLVALVAVVVLSFGNPELAARVGVALLVVTTLVLPTLARVSTLHLALGAHRSSRASSSASDGRAIWAAAALHALTCGWLVALAWQLPTSLSRDLALSSHDATLRAAGFVGVAAVVRPLGSWLSERIGGARVASGAVLAIVPFACLLAWPAIVPFSVGALGCAGILGITLGAALEVVTHLHPRTRVALTIGVSGALGALLVPAGTLLAHEYVGAAWPAFLVLAVAAVVLWRIAELTIVRLERDRLDSLPPGWLRVGEQVRAGAWATAATCILVAAIVVGSRNLRNFDPALVIYTFAVVFATWGVVYHYRVWLSKPPTELYWRRGWEALFRGGLRGILRATVLAANNLLAQRFILERSRLRWWMHQLLFWGCLLAAAVTFPLVFGWLHFTAVPYDPTTYTMHVFGFGVMSFRVDTVFAWVAFHALDIAAILVLAGIALALWRRMRSPDAQALQTFSRDLFPLFLLFAISVTGLALTASTLFMRGTFYSFLSLLHAATVVAALVYLPFGKLFHVFQRPAQLGVKLYLEQAAKAGQARCARCAEPFAPQAQIADLAEVLRKLEFDYSMSGDPARHWQQVCPPCKRKSLGLTTSALARSSRG